MSLSTFQVTPKKPPKLLRWQVVELINWCRTRSGEDEEEELVFEVAERSSDEIAISVTVGISQTTLLVNWVSGRARIERKSMKMRQALDIWSSIISEALDGKIEKAQHRGYFLCRICSETVHLSGAIDIWSHLTGHDIKLEKILVGEGITVKVGEKTIDLDDYLVGEDTPIH